MEAIIIAFLGSLIGVASAIGVGAVANALLDGAVLAELEGLQVLRFELELGPHL
ncbi:hypothetical protein ACX80L_06960 [Arthrobacter sp. MDT1-48-3]